MVQENLLNWIDSDKLRVHVVWTPVLSGDSREVVERSQLIIYDERATHYWDGEQHLGQLYGEIIELPIGRDLAWDIYFVFDEGVEWRSRAPSPVAWAHQLAMDERHLRDGDRLKTSIEGLLGPR